MIDRKIYILLAAILATNLISMPAFAVNRYVSTSGLDSGGAYTNWPTAARTIQAAVNASGASDTIWVSNGVYNISSQISVNVSSLKIKGFTNASNTIINAGNSNRCFYLTANATLENLTITNGYALYGAGVYLASGAIITNCIITGNYTPTNGFGAGIYMNNGGRIDNTTIENNSAGLKGGGAFIATNGSIYNSTIKKNHTAQFATTDPSLFGGGAGIYCSNGGFIATCTISENSDTNKGDGGGVYLKNGGTVTNCAITYNTCHGYGGGVLIDTTGTVVDCTIKGNQISETLNIYGAGIAVDEGGMIQRCLIANNSGTDYGGGVWLFGTSSRIQDSVVLGNESYYKAGGLYAQGGEVLNCTIINNSVYTTSGTGGGIYCETGIVTTVKNTIIYNNSADFNPNYFQGGATISYSCSPGLSGGGNISGDPKFFPFPTEYHLASNSPCINTGNGRISTEKDIDRQPRLQVTNTVDIGADEYSTNKLVTADTGAPMFSGYESVEGTPANMDGSGSTKVSGDALKYRWNFGDGSYTDWSSSPLTSHNYIMDGTYTTTLLVVNNVGFAFDSDPVTIWNDIPVVSAGGPYTAYVGESLSVTAIGSDGGVQDSLDYRFDWGSGWSNWYSVIGPGPYSYQESHTYTSTGTVNVKVQIRDELNTNNTSANVTIKHSVTSSIAGPITGAEGVPVTFNGSPSTKRSGTALQYRWDFGNGGGWTAWSSSPTSSYTYADEGTGTYSTFLQVTNSIDTDTSSRIVTISNTPPTISSMNFNPYELWLGNPLAVTVSASDPGTNDTINYSFNMETGWAPWQASSTTNHIYTNAGTKVIYVQARDNDSGTSAVYGASIDVIIAKAASADISGGNFTMQWNIITNQEYLLQRSTNLLYTNGWTDITGVITATNLFNYIETNSFPEAFYRIILN